MAGWFKSPSGWPVHADTDDEQAELTARGYDPITEAQVQPAIDAFRAAEASPPSAQLPGWLLAADLPARMDAVAADSGSAFSVRQRAAYGTPTIHLPTGNPKSMFEGPVMLDGLGVPGTVTVGVDPDRGPTRWAMNPTTGRLYGDYDTGAGFPFHDVGGHVVWPDAQVVRFGNRYLTVMFGPTTASAGIYWSNDFSLSGWTKVHDLTTNGSFGGSATPIGTGIATDGTTALVAEYGDPRSGTTPAPKIWRSTNDDPGGYGSIWTQVYAGGERHIHAVEFDPYNPGHVYATTGDGDATAKLMRSTDSGATWTTVFSGQSRYQAVQISFSPNFIWLAADSDSIPAIVVDRATMTPRLAARNSHQQIAVPGGAPGDSFHSQAFYGAYDEDTDRYYFVTHSAGTYGNRHGAFYIDEPGGTVHLLCPLPDSFVSQRVYFTGSGAGRQMFAGNARIDIGAAPIAEEAASVPLEGAKWGTATQPLVIPSVWAHQEDVGGKLHYAKARGFTAITFADLDQAIQTGKALPPKPFLLSFDDEPQQWLSVIDPLLEQFGWRATGFISTGYPDGEEMTGGADPYFYTNTQPLTWTQLRQLRDTGRWDFQNHSRSHPSFSTLTPAQRAAEWDYSQQRIADELGVTPTVFCHPRDDWSLATVQEAFDHGFHIVTIGSQAFSGYGPADLMPPQVLANRSRNQAVLWRGAVNSVSTFENMMEPVGNRIPDSPLDDNSHGVWIVNAGAENSPTQGVRFDFPDKSAAIDMRTDGTGPVWFWTQHRIAVRPGEVLPFTYYRQCGVGAGTYAINLVEYDMAGTLLRRTTYESLTGTVAEALKTGTYAVPDDVFSVRIEARIDGAPAGSYATLKFPFFGSAR